MMRRFRALLKNGAVAAFLPVTVVALLSIYRPAFLAGAERVTSDALLRLARTYPPDGRVAIVDIDERSLTEVGQWPWRRDVLGTLVSSVRSLGAAAVAVDVLLSEPERAALGSVSTDAELADALRGGGVVVGFALTFDHPEDPPSLCLQHPLGLAITSRNGDDDADPFFHATGAICSLPQLTRAAGASGFLNAAPDSDGILRRVPLLIQHNGRVYPSLALAAVAAARGVRHADLEVVNANTLWLNLDEQHVPLDGKSHLPVRYRGVKRTFPYVSATDVLSDRVPPGAFAGKIVFIGTTALGTREVVATPLDTLFAGVEVHATIADNLLRGDFLHRPEHAVAVETLVAIASGALAIVLGVWLGFMRGAAALTLCCVAEWAGAVGLLSSTGALVSPLFPTLGLATTLGVMAGMQLIFERSRADQAVEDKTASRRMMIQSLLSLTETRDAETGQHSRRTQRNMRLLAETLATRPKYHAYLTPDRIELLSALAPLHDIGKVGVADRVLHKPAALTADEIVEIRKHPALGREVIARAQADIGMGDDRDGLLSLAKEIVYSHHEKWDGTGYPEGLRGEEIPLAGRLMAVVDVYDATVMRRRYQKAMSHEDALKVIVDGRGSHFDPAVVDAFVEISERLRDSHAEAGGDARHG
jgi:HD-GYP domain-containing protein (c-di-GMP phosphodiesterase class II)/CHASE2 domain-containing sensor protein